VHVTRVAQTQNTHTLTHTLPRYVIARETGLSSTGIADTQIFLKTIFWTVRVLITRTHTKLAGARAIGARLCSCCTGGPTSATIIYYSRANTIHRRCCRYKSGGCGGLRFTRCLKINALACVCSRVYAYVGTRRRPRLGGGGSLRQQLWPPASSRPTSVIRPSPLGWERPRRGVEGVRLRPDEHNNNFFYKFRPTDDRKNARRIM